MGILHEGLGAFHYFRRHKSPQKRSIQVKRFQALMVADELQRLQNVFTSKLLKLTHC
jgi:hypothetical protein